MKKFDGYEAADRVIGAADRTTPEQLQVVVLHSALERELQHAITHHTRRPPRVSGFRPKAYMFHAIWEATDERADALLKVLLALDELRNTIGHGNDGVETCHLNLLTAYRLLEPKGPESPSYFHIVKGICAYIGFDMMPSDIDWLMAELDSLELQNEEDEDSEP